MLPFWPATSQVGRGCSSRPAQSPTAEEFVNFLSDARNIMIAKKMHPRFVYDNPYIHVGSKAQDFMREKDIDPALHFCIPAFSPEFNKVIEHAHARLKHRVETALSQPHAPWSFQMIRDIVEQAFQEVNTPATIKPDVESLPAMYDQILDAKGGHIRRLYR
jgi:hypothetical protein